MTTRKFLHLPRLLVWPAVIGIACCESLLAQSKVVDDFESLEGWKPITTEGATLALSSVQGRSGNAMVMDFDLRHVSGYVIAQKDVDIDLPADYEFTFDMRADAPVNNFEFKLIDAKENVFWLKQLNIRYPIEWTHERIRKRQITFAWGPSRGLKLRNVRKIEFVVSCGTGGVGKVYIDNFRLHTIDDAAAKTAHARIVPPHNGASIDSKGTQVTHWHPSTSSDSLVVDFGFLKEVGGLILQWDTAAFAAAYQVDLSDDGKEWNTEYTVANGNGGRDYIPMRDAEGRFLKLRLTAGNNPKQPILRTAIIKGPEFSNSINDVFRTIAADAPIGSYPKYLLNKQSYWTVLGVSGDESKALMNEQGAVEVGKGMFTIEPFLFVDDKLVTWKDVATSPALYYQDLPMPSVFWDYRGLWNVQIEGCAAGVPGNSFVSIRYTVRCKIPNAKAKLFLAIRPFQVNPPWQNLNVEGGVAEIDSIDYQKGMVLVNGRDVIPMTPPSGFGAAEFDQGSITDFLKQGIVPPGHSVHDHFGCASAALAYEFMLDPDQSFDVEIAVPFHGWRGSPQPNMGEDGAGIYFDLMEKSVAAQWGQKLNTFRMELPRSAGPIEQTVKSNLGYILTNRNGAALQPGTRCYDRSWIRDGAVMCQALLRTGNTTEVREFLDWYAAGQFPNGKIPCVIDRRGPDAVPENDSNGEFIYAVLQYFLFTHDTTWLRGKWESVAKTVGYIEALRAQGKTEKYRNGTPQERSFFGLVPKSISHEGYSDMPRHSYWDDFFTLRGLKDACTIASLLGESDTAAAYANERDDFRQDLYASMRLAMKNTHIDYIPGCAELGDFDATSTTIGVDPGGELGLIPEPQLHNTFDKYYAFFKDRKSNNRYQDYTPYETRVIGTFVELGQKKRAEEGLQFFMKDRRPPEWNQWAEVVWRDPSTPKYIGDMPHAWVGADFVRSVFAMFLYERERDSAHVLAAGIPDRWINDSAGVRIDGMRTYYGTVSYDIHREAKTVTVDVSGTFDAANHRLILSSPLGAKCKGVRVDHKQAAIGRNGEVVLHSLPAFVEFSY